VLAVLVVLEDMRNRRQPVRKRREVTKNRQWVHRHRRLDPWERRHHPEEEATVRSLYRLLNAVPVSKDLWDHQDHLETMEQEEKMVAMEKMAQQEKMELLRSRLHQSRHHAKLVLQDRPDLLAQPDRKARLVQRDHQEERPPMASEESVVKLVLKDHLVVQEIQARKDLSEMLVQSIQSMDQLDQRVLLDHKVPKDLLDRQAKMANQAMQVAPQAKEKTVILDLLENREHLDREEEKDLLVQLEVANIAQRLELRPVTNHVINGFLEIIRTVETQLSTFKRKVPTISFVCQPTFFVFCNLFNVEASHLPLLEMNNRKIFCD